MHRVHRLRCSVRLLWCSSRRVVDIGDIVLLDATALHTPNDKEDPSNEFQNTSDHNAGNATVEFAIAPAVTVGAAVVGVGIVVIAGRIGRVEVCAKEGCSNNKEDDGGDGEANRPPFHEAGSLWVFRHGDEAD